MSVYSESLLRLARLKICQQAFADEADDLIVGSRMRIATSKELLRRPIQRMP